MSCQPYCWIWFDDKTFTCCRLTFETTLKFRGGPSIVFAHSMGNNVFRYFLEWLKHEIAPKNYVQWLDDHIHAYFAVGILPRLLLCFSHNISWVTWMLVYWVLPAHCISGAPLLGSPEIVKGTLFGVTFGIPISEVIIFCFKFFCVCLLLSSAFILSKQQQ